ncbi:MAG: endonuclease/exonuclease/phosphatase family protein [Saprospiraceae bacterium]|nr:endonuclease/exonuclease/phosphatase family protein [Saprospiraceae bacterium]
MSYNIHHGANADDDLTIKEMRKYIKKSGVSIVGLQEVDSVCERSASMDEVKELAHGSKFKGYFTRHFAFQGGAYGQGLLSKYKVSSLRNMEIPIYPEEEGKSVSMLLADIQIDKHLIITVAVVHLDYRNKSSRLQQIELISRILKDEVHPVILLGDFNAYYRSDEIEILKERFTLFEISEDAYTYPARNPDRRIDFIFISKGAPLRVVSERIDSVDFSDHLPLIATIQY